MLINHQRIARAVAKTDSKLQEQMNQVSSSLNDVEKAERVQREAAPAAAGKTEENRDLAVMAASDAPKVGNGRKRLGWQKLPNRCFGVWSGYRTFCLVVSEHPSERPKAPRDFGAFFGANNVERTWAREIRILKKAGACFVRFACVPQCVDFDVVEIL